MDDQQGGMSEFLTKRRVKTFVSALGILFFVILVYIAREVLYPFIIAFAIAYLLDPAIDQLETKKINRSVAILLLLSLFFSIAISFFMIVGPLAFSQIEEMGRAAPGYFDRIVEKIKPMLDAIPQFDRDRLEDTLKEGLVALGDLPLKVVKGISASAWAGVSSVMGFALALVNAIIIPVAAFYLLKDFDIIVAKINDRIPPRHRGVVTDFVSKIDVVLSGFVRGQLIVAMIMSTLLSFGLLMTGTPMGLVIGMVAGLANVVPYLAVLVGFAPAVLLTYLEFGDWQHPAMVVAVFGVAQALEGFVISPKVLEESVGLHPVAIMASILVGAHFFGFIGLLLAVPAAAVIKVALEEFDGLYKSSDLYGADPEEIVDAPEVGAESDDVDSESEEPGDTGE